MRSNGGRPTKKKTVARNRYPRKRDTATNPAGPQPELQLPVSYEEAKQLFSQETLVQKLMDFVVPLENDEERIIKHLTRAKVSGKILFIFGLPGSGKSTFIESLGWRKHIGIRRLHHLPAAHHHPPDGLTAVLRDLQELARQATTERALGPTAIVVDYLESLDGFEDEAVRGFFRALNGILRGSPLLLLWPVVNESDVKKMISFSEGVSGTMFTKGEEIMRFSGPPADRFVNIAETTISVANDGRPITDFGLTRGDLDEIVLGQSKAVQSDRVIRRYLESVRETWTEKSGYLSTAVSKIPKFSEVWFIICHTKAEEVVKQFVRRGDAVDDAWTANHDALYEYVKGTQREGFWTARRLQLAISGVLRTRILFIPTNCMVAAIAAYTQNNKLRQLIIDNGGSRNWLLTARALKYFESTPLFRQLSGDPPLVGKRKSGPGYQAIIKADPAFEAINRWLSKDKGHDSILNAAIGSMIKEKLGSRVDIHVGKKHPWIPNIVPDIRVDPKGAKRHINLEFHFTNKKQPNEVADYCLRKMQSYLQQVELYIGADGAGQALAAE